MMKPLVGAILGVMIDPARGTSGKHLAEVYARCDNALHPPTVFWPAVS